MSPTLVWVMGLTALVSAQPAASSRAPTTQPAATSQSAGQSTTVSTRPDLTAAPLTERRLRPPPLTPSQLVEHFGLIKGNNTPEARRLGATRLLETGTPDAIARLSDILQSATPDLAAQVAVCEAIADAEEPSLELIPPLLALLGDKRAGLTEAVIHALIRFKSDAVVQQLGLLAANDQSDFERRLGAISALASMSDRLQAVEALVNLVHDPSPTVRAMALAGFRQATNTEAADPEAARGWWAANHNVSDIDWLRRRNDQRAVDNRKLTTELSAITNRLVLAYREAYHRFPEGERPRKLLSLLNDSVAAVRMLALDLVNDLITDRKDISPEIKSRLIDMLTDSSPLVRLQTTRMVGDLRLPGSFAKLARAITQESEPVVRAAQANAIGRLDDPNAVSALIDSLDDDVPAVIGEAALALGRCSRRQDWAKLGAAESLAAIPGIMASRFTLIRPTQHELREQFLTAMAMIGDARFRPIFRQEMKSDRSLRVRRAAITGLASFGDVEAADDIRTCLTDPETEIRLAAADGLAKCGRRRGDLGALAERLNPPVETEGSVRQRAWESYLLIAAQLPPEEQIKVSDEFDRPTDKVAQRRRLELLKPLTVEARVVGGTGGKSGGAKYEQLPKARRADVFERMADAQWNLGEYSSAAGSLDQAIDLVEDSDRGRSLVLSTRSVMARLKSHEDAAALQRIKELLTDSAGEPDAREALTRAVFEEIRGRSESATEAAVYTDVLNLIELSKQTLRGADGTFEETLSELRKDVQSRRATAINRLLSTLASDAEAEAKLLAYPREVVLFHLHERLRPTATTSAPVDDMEDRYLQLAKRLAPGWSGFAPDATPADRATALDQLLEVANTARSTNGANTSRVTEERGVFKAQGMQDEP